MVTVYDLNNKRIAGEYNGYTYQFMQQIGTNYYYRLTNPEGRNKLVSVSTEKDLTELCDNVESFWNKYC